MCGTRTAEFKFSAENLNEPVPRPKVSDGELLSRGRVPYSPHMFLPAHLAAGLIIGKLTGNYTVSLISSVGVDLDHLLAYYHSGILLKFKKMVIASTVEANSIINQRNIFHNIFFVLAVSTIIILINFKVGLVFFLACLSHLLLDSLDDSNYFPFYPNKKINLRGPIKYFSRQEFIFTLVLFFIFFII